MSDVVSNPPTQAGAESKSARKKKAKAAAVAPSGTNEKTTSEISLSSPAAEKPNGTDGSSESQYVKDLQRSIRSVNKKLTLMHKLDSVVAENPGVSLDDLVASRKINNDQKAQALKKPGLQAQLTQYEEQLTQFKKFDAEYKQKSAAEKELLQSGHKEELEKLRETLKEEAAVEAKKAFKDRFLTLSRFLRAAAARRQLDNDDTDVTKAFEGALLLVYGGDASAVAAAEKLIEGTEDLVPSTEGVPLNVTYSQIKQAALEEAPFAAEEAWVEDVAQSQAAAPEEPTTTIQSDPTIAHAGLTELDTSGTITNGGSEALDTPSAPAASNIDAGAANAAADEQWDRQASALSDDPLTESFEMIPRDPAETETPHVAAPNNSTQSWADDTPEAAPPAPTNGNDGFHEVQHRGRGRGGFQGEGRGGGGYRGRGGPRGEGRGRGRGRGEGNYRPRGRGGFRGGERGDRGGAQ